MATIYYTASTVDGFIAAPDHSLEWLLSRDIDRSGAMNYPSFIANVGAIAMGSHTYEWIRDHGGGGWEYEQPTWVFTTREMQRYGAGGAVHFTDADVCEVHAELAAAADGRDVWVCGGGDLAGQFADAGLLDELWVQWAPVALGAGAPLLPRQIELRLDDLARNNDFACARYSVVR
ncbi:MAG: dihydrofolate reductase family protein [Candidatus Nanopelagicales bacterium]